MAKTKEQISYNMSRVKNKNSKIEMLLSLETLKRHKIREHEKGHGFGYCVVNQEGGEHPIANTILATGGSGKERNLIYQPKEGISGKVIPRKKTRLN